MNITLIYGRGKGNADPAVDNESNLKEKVSSAPKTIVPPIYNLLQAWYSNLDQLSFTVALQSIKSFAAIIQKISAKQQEELKQEESV